MNDAIVSNNSEEFYAIMAREKAGEFRIGTMSVGKTNSQWIFETYPPLPKPLPLKTSAKPPRKIHGYFAAAAAAAQAAAKAPEPPQSAQESSKASEASNGQAKPPERAAEPVADLKQAPRVKVNLAPELGERLPPHSLEAEQGVLGCIMLNAVECLGICIEQLEPDSFHSLQHRTIYETMLELEEGRTQIDTITLQQRLKDKGQLDSIGGLAYISALPDMVPSAANLQHYLDIVQQKHLLRKTLALCTETQTRCYEDESNATKIVEEFETAALKIARVESTSKTTKHHVEVVQEQIEQYQANKGRLSGLSTGFHELDWKLFGLNPCDMIVIGGRTSTGKTSIALNIADAVAITQKQPVGFFSMEMSAESLVFRLMCSRAEVDSSTVRRGQCDDEEIKRLSNAGIALRKAPLHIEDKGSLRIAAMQAKARRMVHEFGVKLFVIDFLQRLQGNRRRKGETLEQEIGEISNGIKQIAMDLRLPIIVLAQLNRESEKEGRKPKMTDLRGSGSIEQDADAIGLLYRPQKKKDKDEDPNDREYPVNLLLAKMRNGATGEIGLYFKKQFTRFYKASRINDEADSP